MPIHILHADTVLLARVVYSLQYVYSKLAISMGLRKKLVKFVVKVSQKTFKISN
ncbi:hypothetical protein [Neorickettsia sennetsu]|uniref:hypothetical protein n=1 Tax=Ehrlichia sennetsu TaxID=951 RepID=UPI000325C5D1|nr:hypothetical protein [Neorickettsia sennetsu]